MLKWIQHVALEGAAYKNEMVEIFGEEGNAITTEEVDSMWGAPEPVNLQTGEMAGQMAGTGNDIENKIEGEVRGDDAKANGKAVEAQKAEAGDTKADEAKSNSPKSDTGNPQCPPADDGPEAKDMVELVTEIEDLKLHH